MKLVRLIPKENSKFHFGGGIFGGKFSNISFPQFIFCDS
ncbi:hypothetical protein MetfoDRAFT_0952 [Methanotorris formicicus Mc-S-70]|uniref:Uncharacterized protein n=1 Tax=Methanotorris formicicus Mc-S-70 TaxID=647171 RepID=H1KYS9_9EURY|nr:hypothetical protein MetfoDRAFT_0952 [Methanotorris formicicus Mc-S-70]